MSGSITRVLASSMALSAFAIACLAGMTSGNEANSTLVRALVSMAICYLAGTLLGMLAEWVVENHLREYKARNPIPQPVRPEQPVMEVGEAPEEPARGPASPLPSSQTSQADRRAA